MTKKIEWKESNIDYDALNKITHRSLVATERGNQNKSLGKIGSGLGNIESRRKGQKNSVQNQIESGTFKNWLDSGKKAAAEKSINDKLERIERFYALIYLKFKNDTFNILDLKILDSYFPEYTSHSKAYRRFLEDNKLYQFLGYKNKSKMYKIIWNLEN